MTSEMKPTLEEIQKLFPTGDYIEYETGNGFFSGMIIGYESSKYGISLELGDRQFPVWNDKGLKYAEMYHKKIRTEIIHVPEVVQLTLF